MWELVQSRQEIMSLFKEKTAGVILRFFFTIFLRLFHIVGFVNFTKY